MLAGIMALARGNDPFALEKSVPRKRDHSVDRAALKALVAIFGPREAARQSNIPFGTVASYCYRYQWKKAKGFKPTTGINREAVETNKDAADAIAEAMASHKQEATVNLAHYAAKASKQAVEVADPLSHARAVRDVAAVYRTIYPPEDGGEMIEGAILIGAGVVKDNPVEIAERTIDVRENVSDQRAESH